MAREFTKDERELIRRGRAMEALVASDGWKVLREVLQVQMDTYGTQAVMPCRDLNAVLPGEFAKGALVGLQLSINMPATILRESKELLASGGEDSEE